MAYFGKFYLDKEKDILIELYIKNRMMSFILRTPNHHTGNLITNLAKVLQVPISFDENGVCSACNNEKRKDSIDWSSRYKELEKLCDKYRGMNGNEPDCAIAVSGGKDSHFQVHVMKEKMGMNPILFSVEDNFTMTEAGKANLKNISEEFGCSIISLKPDIRTQKLLMRKTFEEYGKPTWFIDRLIYTYPLKMALRFNTPLLVYGENVSWEYGGNDAKKETYSAKEILANGVASDISEQKLLESGVSAKDLALTIAPSKSEIEKLEPIYLSYFYARVLNHKKNFYMKELVDQIKAQMEAFSKDADAQVVKGNKAAGTRARKAALELSKLLKEFRKVSVAESKK